MFTEAMFRVIDAQVDHIGFGFDPEVVNANFDAVVIPAANWLNASNDWDWLTERIEKLTVPVALIGIGLQAPRRDLTLVEVKDSALNLVRTIAERNPAISVRGDFTREWLHSVGVTNVVTTGCPSLYMNVFEQAGAQRSGTVAFQGTRYFASTSFNAKNLIESHIFQTCAAVDMPMIFQSEAEETQNLALKTPITEMSPASQTALAELYGLPDPLAVQEWLARNGKIFFDVYSWSGFVSGLHGVIGSRLHGTIISLNSGVPALLYGHDSRTHELIEFASLPSISGDDLLALSTLDDVRAAIADADLQAYRDRRSDNQRTFHAFLGQFGLHPHPEAMF